MRVDRLARSDRDGGGTATQLACARAAVDADITLAFGGVAALQTSASRSRRARSARSSARTAPARVRCSTSSAASTGPTRAHRDRRRDASPASRPAARAARRRAHLPEPRAVPGPQRPRQRRHGPRLRRPRRASSTSSLRLAACPPRGARAARPRRPRIVDFLDLGASRDRPVGTLPYGLQKRVELARALVAEPRLLLLDEPMAGMTAEREGGDERASSAPPATSSAPPSSSSSTTSAW